MAVAGRDVEQELRDFESSWQQRSEATLDSAIAQEVRRLRVRKQALSTLETEEMAEAAARARQQTSAVQALVLSVESLRGMAGDVPLWLVPGVLAKGHALMVSSRPKAGKGTLVAYLLAAIESGSETIFGEGAGEQLSALIYSEEPLDSMKEKTDFFPLTRAGYLFGWQARTYLAGLQGAARWAALVALLVDAAVAGGHSLLFIDNVSRAAGVEEEAGVELARRIEELAEACKAAGLTLIIDHHHRKASGSAFDLARGGDGHTGAVECSLNLIRKSDDPEDRRRKLVCYGRLRAHHWSKLVEWSEDGHEYLVLDEADSTAASADGHGAGSLEAKRLKLLRELCLARKTETGSEWVLPEDAAEVWGVLARSAKAWLVDRVPAGSVMTGPLDGRKRTFAAPGWETADAATDHPAY